MESDHNGCAYVIGNGHMIPGLQMASKAFEIIQCMKLGESHELPIYLGRKSARINNGSEGSGNGKKQMPVCNGLDRGSNFASTRIQWIDIDWDKVTQSIKQATNQNYKSSFRRKITISK